MADKWVRMRHPNLEGDSTALVTQSSFDRLWAGKGWVLVDDEPNPKPKRTRAAKVEIGTDEPDAVSDADPPPSTE